MNYRHAFHAGNACDVIKHAALALVIQMLTLKRGALTVLETHAGSGLYDLAGEEAERTGEAQRGVVRFWEHVRTEGDEPLLAPYRAALARANPDGGALRWYPGSPLLIHGLLRPAEASKGALREGLPDTLVACEWHPVAFGELQRALGTERRLRQSPQVRLHRRDGYEALRALLPKPGARGFVLIDPPYEDALEFARLTEAVRAMQAQWPEGRGMIWYPLKDRSALWRWHESLRVAGVPGILAAECRLEDDSRADRLAGTGLLFVNPPWRFEETLATLFPLLHRLLEAPCPGSSCEWLTPPRG